MWTVKLLRGYLQEKNWEHNSLRSAMVRVNALSDLHSAPFELDQVNKIATINATEWYS